jgi:recombination protein RecT
MTNTNPTPKPTASTAAAVVKKTEHPLAPRIREWEADLTSRMSQLKALLPARAGDPQRFARMCVMAVVRNPDLLAADRSTLLLAVMNAAELGLSCSGGPGARAHLVPFKGKVTLIPDYKGLIDIALASGKVSTLEGHAVYAKDKFEERLGSEKSLIHVPNHDVEDRGALIGTYGIAWLPNASHPVWRYLKKNEIEKARPSHTYNTRSDNPWNTWYDEMAIKTSIRKLYKWLPTTPEMEKAEEIDDALTLDVTLPQSDATVIATTTPPPTPQRADIPYEPEGFGHEAGRQPGDEKDGAS